ncbi:MAG: hypothetical protein AAF149_07120 [Bacteroidota bacterium]
MKRQILVFISMILSCNSTTIYDESLFEKGKGLGALANDEINEASGLEASQINPGLLWTHNDSGDTSRLFLIHENGEDVGEFYLKGVRNRDWEDIAVGPGPVKNENYLYIAEIGDNQAIYEDKYIYRFKEPQADRSSLIDNYNIIEFRYPDGNRDAECLMIDPLTKDLYIISKRERQVHIYLMSYPQNVDNINELVKLGTLPHLKIIAGDISPDGREIILKTYDEILYWRRNDDESVIEALSRAAINIPYKSEPQGEAMAWKNDGSGFYTLSEEPDDTEAQLYFYKRK